MQLVEISSLVLCPRSQGAEQREVVLQVRMMMMVMMMLMVMMVMMTRWCAGC